MNYKIVKHGEKFYIQKGWIFHSYMDNTQKDSLYGDVWFGHWWGICQKQDFIQRNCSFESLEKAENHWAEYKFETKKSKKYEVVKHIK